MAANACTGTAISRSRSAIPRRRALTLPGTITATADQPSGAVVTYTASASDLVDGARPVPAHRPRAARSPIGTTSVSCSASDLHGNAASGSFAVIVTAAAVPGRMIGDGKIEIGAVTHSFDFFVQERAGADLERDQIPRQDRQPARQGSGRRVRSPIGGDRRVTFFNVPGVSPGSQPASGVDTVTFAGTGRCNGRSGYSF